MNTKQLQLVTDANVKNAREPSGARVERRRGHGKAKDFPFQFETSALSGSERTEQEASTCCEWALPPAKSQPH
jgi:hypothetical protein